VQFLEKNGKFLQYIKKCQLFFMGADRSMPFYLDADGHEQPAAARDTIESFILLALHVSAGL
jgi:hypothetical protein